MGYSSRNCIPSINSTSARTGSFIQEGGRTANPPKPVFPFLESQGLEKAFLDLQGKITGERLRRDHPFLHEELPELLPSLFLACQDPAPLLPGAPRRARPGGHEHPPAALPQKGISSPVLRRKY